MELKFTARSVERVHEQLCRVLLEARHPDSDMPINRHSLCVDVKPGTPEADRLIAAVYTCETLIFTLAGPTAAVTK